MRDDLKALGQRLRSARIDAHHGQPEVAKRLGVSKQLVSHWELGRSEITIFDLTKFAALTGASLEFLLTGLDRPGGNVRLVMPRGRLVPKLTADEIVQYAKAKLNPATVAARHATMSAVSERAIALAPPNRGIYSDPDRVTIVVDLDRAIQPGDIGLWVLAGGEVLLARYRPAAGAKPPGPPFTLRFDDEDFAPREVTKADRPVFLGSKIEHSTASSR